jgi:hypothetical protein
MGNIVLPDKTVLEGLQIVFVNPETKSFTFAIYFPDTEFTCVLVGGQGFGPMTIPNDSNKNNDLQQSPLDYIPEKLEFSA